MIYLAKVIQKLRERKMMVRLAVFPSGLCTLAIYDSEKQMKQHLYEAADFMEIERLLAEDWSERLFSKEAMRDVESRFVKTPMPTMPTPPGFPKPPGVK